MRESAPSEASDVQTTPKVDEGVIFEIRDV
jgi:hypothetical protein